ncbi:MULTISPECIES: acetyltransferase [Clostridia]|uniref:acetyltransferase n=1 Tax=Clostridia TaxID=186801 RepID=UPI000EA23480|nr:MULTISPECIES: acetyltransferase [Clostridia]NBJ70844.1 acetyltransferase [Roseburia sp. 1XD42-34]RKI75706.1 acetyltransferase [Clostridium sp. 1xD42-85]
MKNKLLIIGASGHGKVLADIAKKMNQWKSIAFLDDDTSKKEVLDLEVIGTINEAFEHVHRYSFIVGIGNNEIRKHIQEEINCENGEIATLIHPSACIGEEVVIGIGTVIMANAVINSGTKIGNGCIINTAATVDHDNIINDYVHVSPGAHLAGNVQIGSESWLGIGSIVNNNISIIANTLIGAGGTVVKDIKKSGTYVGVPVRRLKNG